MRGSQPWKTNRSRVLRAHSTSAEAQLWRRLRNRQFGGLKFVRQAPIGPYYVDFLCRSEWLIVEIDGGTHSTKDELARDAKRERFLTAQGYRVFRLTNHDVYEDMEGALDTLLVALAANTNP